jgi:hypothetical protein
LSKICRKKKDSIGLIIASVGVGILLTGIIPIFGWIIGAGVILIYCGWQIMCHHHR